ncbi:hypothetical protein [Halomonas sp. N3-2A]|nr:hypothetical protein [Halomonas sp. N3-2A]
MKRTRWMPHPQRRRSRPKASSQHCIDTPAGALTLTPRYKINAHRSAV